MCCFSTVAAEFPKPYDSEPDAGAGPMKPEQAAAEMQLPPGFKATVFAAEPDVCNPIALAWDAKGRLWVAENYTYAEAPLKFELKLRDRILIFDDKDGDGRFDERKVFADDLQMLTGIEVGLGGVWAMCPPQVLFLADKDGDDKPDGAPQTVLDGFRVPPENFHNFANGLRFGPDGWLYGRCGASAPGEVGTPGTPVAERIPMRGGMWRYSPRTKVFEALTSGTTNPWGHDWNRHGELFFINTVNGHLWHMVPGMHFTRPHTLDPNPRVYELIDTHADHWHFDVGGGWQKSRDGAANSLGGGHAHIGCFIYNDDAWPEEFRDRLYTLNMHGRRVNRERLDREGSGYVARHEPDFLVVTDPFFRGMELTLGPDGALYIADWSDTGECHERNGVHRSSGRIYKITRELPPPDLRPKTDQGFLRQSDWYTRSLLSEIAAFVHEEPGEKAQEFAALISSGELATANPDRTELVFLWAHMSLKLPLPPDQSVAALQQKNEHLRCWFIRWRTDDWPLDTMMSARPARAANYPAPDRELLAQFVKLAESDASPLVRLTLASTLQRLPVTDRIPLATALAAHSEDANDHNIPLMIWYGLIPTADSNADELAALAANAKIPTVRRLVARRLAEDVAKRPEPFAALLALVEATGDVGRARDVVEGAKAALVGRHKAPKPATWEKFAALASRSNDAAIQNAVRDLSVLFGDGRALDAVKALALDNDADVETRKAALETLLDARPPELRGICERAIKVRFLNPVAARGLALFDDDDAAATLVGAYKGFHHSERAQLIAVLASRPRFAKALLAAVADGRILKTDLTASVARQIHDYGDAELDELLRQTWGEFRDSPAEKKEQIAKLKEQLTKSALAAADKSAGRALFAKTCAACHKFFGEGQTVGPDLTGANRDNLDYLLENMIDPSAVVSADFRMSVLTLADGRVLNGLVLAETDATLTLRTATETVTLDRTDVEDRRQVPLSLMPENQLQTLTPDQIRDLIGYLQTREQVALPTE
jgi:putative membrane-bound dehydrogenase-like protein